MKQTHNRNKKHAHFGIQIIGEQKLSTNELMKQCMRLRSKTHNQNTVFVHPDDLTTEVTGNRHIIIILHH